MRLRRRAAFLLPLTALLTLASAVSATAGPADPVSVLRVVPTWATLTPGQLQDLRTAPATWPFPPGDDATPVLALAQYATGSGYEPAADPATFAECDATYATGFKKVGWYKNTFSRCTISTLRFQTFACADPACASTGTASARLTTITSALPGQRRAAVSTRLSGWVVDGVPDTTPFGIALSCGEGYHPDGSTTHCDLPQTSVVKTLADWQAQPVETQEYDLQGEDVPYSGWTPQRQAEKWTIYLVASRAFSGDAPQVAADDTSAGVQCDIARSLFEGYVGGSDCIIGSPPLIVSIDGNDPATKESAKLVEAMLTNIRSTYPGLAGTHAAGIVWQSEVLPRIYYDAAARDYHRTSAEQVCANHWPGYTTGPNGEAFACAAYPFSSTTQGAWLPATPHGTAMFGVKPVPAADFAELEARLARMYVAAHVLDGKQYWVKVTH